MVKAKKVKLAIFDIDGTIFRSSLLIEIVCELVARGIFPRQAEKIVEKDYLAWVDRKASYDHYIMKVVQVYERYIAGCSQKKVQDIARTVIRFHKNRQYRFTRDLIEELRAKGYYLVAVSGSPHEIVEIFVKTMRFDAAFGTLYEVRDGIFTGKIQKDNTVRNKAQVINEFLPDFGLTADLKNSVAVGDTQGDIPALKLVGNPIAFNPNLVLAQWAQKNHIPIVVERKNVIYKLRDFAIQVTHEN